MFKGQEFDTFKLMIAAVIAVAILGIMLTILGGIITPGQSFDDTAKQLLQKAVQSPTAVYPSSGEVSFKAGESYPSAVFKPSAGGARNIVFKSPVLCAAGSTLCDMGTAAAPVLTIKGNFKATVYVCCKTGTGECQIGIGTGSNGESPVSC